MNLFKKKTKLISPANGKIDRIENYPDDAISQKMLGDGFFVEPTDGMVVSPVDGEVVALFPTGHAVGIKTSDTELLIHIGVDTVMMKGDGFSTKVKEGSKVKAGDLLVVFDLEKVHAHPEAKAASIAVVFTGMDKTVTVLKPGTEVKLGQTDIVDLK